MASSQHDVINFSALERELQGALESERRYQRENEAKLRAVGQQVASYDQFRYVLHGLQADHVTLQVCLTGAAVSDRDLVLASHLRPLDKKDRDGRSRRQPWNSVVLGNKDVRSSRQPTDV
ncbi:uncharacterized protein V6R79_012034 [Siganus canaliculatus]